MVLFSNLLICNILEEFCYYCDYFVFIFIPKFEYTTDNAAMIGIVGYQKFLHDKFVDQSTVSKSRIEF